jgi:hypothetical protein
VIVGAYSGYIASISVMRDAETWSTERAWASKFRVSVSTPVLSDGKLFGLAQTKLGSFYYVEADTGEVAWTSEGRDAVHASVLDVGESLLALTDRGELIVVRKSEKEYSVAARYQVAALDEDASRLGAEHWGPSVTVAETWAHPVVFDRSILIKEPGYLTLWSLVH